jgi:hypothetical protein
MKLVIILAAGLLVGGCGAEVVAPNPRMVGVEIETPVEYYFWDGQYHYWHDNHFEVVDRVPEGHQWVTVDHPLERPLAPHDNGTASEHRDFNERDEPVR